MVDLSEQIKKAAVELQTKTLNDIQVETAKTWAGRACVAASIGLKQDAIEYAHEAIEHAALSGHEGLLTDIRAALRACGVDA